MKFDPNIYINKPIAISLKPIKIISFGSIVEPFQKHKSQNRLDTNIHLVRSFGKEYSLLDCIADLDCMVMADMALEYMLVMVDIVVE